MRYELDNEGYVLNVYFGCYGTNCTEYTGTTPIGYESLLEWSEKANINAYYINDGNLVYDAYKDAKLQEQIEIDAERNASATVGYVDDILNRKSSPFDETLAKTTTNLRIDDAGNYEIPEIVIEGKGSIKTSTGIIEDARAVKLESIEIEGKSVQETQKNVFNGTLAKTTYTGTGAIVENTATTFKFLKGYTYNIKIKFTSSNVVTSNANRILGLRAYTSTNTQLALGLVISLNNLSSGETNITFTPTEDYNRFAFINYADFTSGTVEIKSFEIITDTPTPDYSSEIKSVEGITNLFDEKLELGNYDNSGNKTTATNIYRNKNIVEVKPNTTYTFSINGVSQKYCVYYYDKNGTFISNNLSLTTGKFTTPANCYYMNFRCFGADFKNDYANLKIQLEEGSIVHSYVPYGRWLEQKTIGRNKFNKDDVLNNIVVNASGGEQTTNNYITSNYIECLPNTNYAISFNYVSGGDASMRFCCYDKNKNFISRIPNETAKNHIQNTPSNCYYIRLSFQKSAFNNVQLEEGITTPYEPYKENTALIDLNKPNLFEKYLDNIEIGNSWNNSANTKRATIVIPYEGNKSYTIKCSKMEGYQYVSIIETADRSTALSSVNNTEPFETTRVSNANTKYICLQLMTTNDFTIDMLDNLELKIYEGTEEYYRLSSIGDVKDTFKDGVLTQRIGKVVLDGSENIISNPYGTNSFQLPILNVKNAPYKITIISSHFVGIPYDDRTKEIANSIFVADIDVLVIRNTTFTSVNEFKTWLSNNPVEVYYELETPIEHTLNYEALELHEGYNNITLNDELESNMSVSYRSLTTTFEDGIKLQVSNSNLLVNTGKQETINGITFTPTEDGKVHVKGTATADVEYELCGTMENKTPMFMLESIHSVREVLGTPVLMRFIIVAMNEEGVNNSVKLNLYNYNDEGRELIVSCYGQFLTIDDVKYVTCATLSIPSGTTIDDTITTCIRKQDSSSDSIQAKTKGIVDINISELDPNEKIIISGQYIKLVNELGKEEVIKSISPLVSYEDNEEYDYTLIQCSEDVNITTTYYTNINVAGFNVTTNGLEIEIRSNYDYTQADVDKAYAYIRGKGTLTEAELIKYDVNGDGIVNVYDCSYMSQLIKYGITTKNALKFSICNKEVNNMLNFITAIDGNGNELTNVSASGITTNSLAINNTTYEYADNKIIPVQYSSVNSGNVTVTDKVNTALASTTLSAGRYIVLTQFSFSANSNGMRRVNISTTSGSGDANIQHGASPSGVTRIRHVQFLNHIQDTTIYWNVCQESGSSLTCSATAWIYRIQ